MKVMARKFDLNPETGKYLLVLQKKMSGYCEEIQINVH
jgi:hypothetical protein